VGDTDRINALEKEIDALKKTINGEGMEDGMKTTIAKTDQKVDELCLKMDRVYGIGIWLIGLMATGVLGMIWEAAKKAPR